MLPSFKHAQIFLLTSKNVFQVFCRTSVIVQQIRRLQVHEHVAYTLLKEAGIPTPTFKVAKTPDEVGRAAKNLDTKDIVLKAQVLTGGRGMGHFKGTNVSGVVMCET